jgi:folate-binding protein YgfZ
MPDAADYERARTDAALFDVSDRGKLEVRGPDAPSFLHNLSTNDILNLPLGAGCEAFFTTAKAKVVAHALVYHVRIAGGRDALWLDLAPGQAKRLLQHLDHFLIAEQVELADHTADFSQFHVVGPRARAVLDAALGEPIPDLGPLEHMERTFGASATCHVRRHEPLNLPGYDILCLSSRSEEVKQRLLAAGAAAAGPEAYEILRVEAGTPIYGKDIDEDRFVVEVGRPAAISYTKGCYLGQEPIVRVRDRGRTNWRLVGLEVAGPADPSPADPLETDAKPRAGRITSAARLPGGGGVAMAMLHVSVPVGADIRIKHGDDTISARVRAEAA